MTFSSQNRLKIVIQSYLAQQKRLKLKRAVTLMKEKYENNAELTVLTTLDKENFYS